MTFRARHLLGIQHLSPAEIITVLDLADRYVDLNRRVRMARQADADLFISLHADAGADPATRGASVYTLSEQGATRAVREVSSRRGSM